MHSSVAVIAFTLFICVRGDAQLTSQTPEHTADHLRGLVVNSLTHEPISHALVLSPDNHFATMTDDRGRFEFAFQAAENPPAMGVVVTGAARPSGSKLAQSPDAIDGPQSWFSSPR